MFHELPPLDVQEVLDEIGRREGATAGDPAGPAPVLTLLLRSGATITGQVLRVGRAGPRRPLLLRRVDALRGPEDALVYVDAAAIEALTVHAASEVLDLLSRGQLDRLPDDVPGRLALQRRAARIGEHASSLLGDPLPVAVAWGGLPDSPEGRWSLSLVLDALAQALEDIAGTPEGLEALRSLEELRIEHGPQPRVCREAGALVLCCTFDAGEQGRLTGSALVRALEASL